MMMGPFHVVGAPPCGGEQSHSICQPITSAVGRRQWPLGRPVQSGARYAGCLRDPPRGGRPGMTQGPNFINSRQAAT